MHETPPKYIVWRLRVTAAVNEESVRSVECIDGVTSDYAPALNQRVMRRRSRRTRLVPWFRWPW